MTTGFHVGLIGVDRGTVLCIDYQPGCYLKGFSCCWQECCVVNVSLVAVDKRTVCWHVRLVAVDRTTACWHVSLVAVDKTSVCWHVSLIAVDRTTVCWHVSLIAVDKTTACCHISLVAVGRGAERRQRGPPARGRCWLVHPDQQRWLLPAGWLVHRAFWRSEPFCGPTIATESDEVMGIKG